MSDIILWGLQWWRLPAPITLTNPIILHIILAPHTPGDCIDLVCLSSSVFCSTNLAGRLCLSDISSKKQYCCCSIVYCSLSLSIPSSYSHHCYILACVWSSGKPFLTFLSFVASISIFLLFTYFFSFDLCPPRWASLSPTFSVSFFYFLRPLSLPFSSLCGYWFLLSIRSSTWIQTRPFA